MNTAIVLIQRRFLKVAVVLGPFVAACQTRDESTTPDDQVAVETPAPSETIHKDEPRPQSARTATTPCKIPVIAKSPHAVANPCLTTAAFINSIATLSDSQKRDAMELVTASSRLLERERSKLAH